MPLLSKIPIGLIALGVKRKLGLDFIIYSIIISVMAYYFPLFFLASSALEFCKRER